MFYFSSRNLSQTLSPARINLHSTNILNWAEHWLLAGSIGDLADVTQLDFRLEQHCMLQNPHTILLQARRDQYAMQGQSHHFVIHAAGGERTLLHTEQLTSSRKPDWTAYSRMRAAGTRKTPTPTNSQLVWLVVPASTADGLIPAEGPCTTSAWKGHRAIESTHAEPR